MLSTFVSLADSPLLQKKPSVSAALTCIFVSGYRKVKAMADTDKNKINIYIFKKILQVLPPRFPFKFTEMNGKNPTLN